MPRGPRDSLVHVDLPGSRLVHVCTRRVPADRATCPHQQRDKRAGAWRAPGPTEWRAGGGPTVLWMFPGGERPPQAPRPSGGSLPGGPADPALGYPP